MRLRWLGAAVLVVGVLALCPGPSAGQPPGGGMTFQVQPGGGFPGGGQPGGFGQPGGGRGGFGGGKIDPEMIWGFMGGAGKDSIDLNQNPQLKQRMEQRGEPLPPNGILTKQAFLEGMQKRMAAGGGMGGPGGGAMASPGGQPTTMSFGPGGPPGGNFDRGRGRGEGGPGGQNPNWGGQSPGGWGGQNPGWGQPGQFPGQPGFPGQYPGGENGQGQGPPPEKKDDFSQIAVRFGRLPPGLPDWFTSLDTDKDGQVGLYEWRADGRKSADFTPMDLDGDGLIAPQEYLRYVGLDADQKRAASIEANGVPDAPAARPAGGRPGGGTGAGGSGPPAFGAGGTRGQWGPGGGKGGDNTSGGGMGKKGGDRKKGG